MALSFTLAGLTPSLNRTQRQHWTVRRRHQRALAWEVRAGLLGAVQAPLERAHVTIYRHSVGTLDEDNMAGGCKSLLDVLKPASKNNPFGLGIIADDRPECLSVAYRQVKAKNRREQKTCVVVEAITA